MVTDHQALIYLTNLNHSSKRRIGKIKTIHEHVRFELSDKKIRELQQADPKIESIIKQTKVRHGKFNNFRLDNDILFCIKNKINLSNKIN